MIADIFFNMFKHLSPSELLWNRSLEFWITWITQLRPSKPSNSGHPGPSHYTRLKKTGLLAWSFSRSRPRNQSFVWLDIGKIPP